jgi:hypothetical protein
MVAPGAPAGNPQPRRAQLAGPRRSTALADGTLHDEQVPAGQVRVLLRRAGHLTGRPDASPAGPPESDGTFALLPLTARLWQVSSTRAASDLAGREPAAQVAATGGRGLTDHESGYKQP